MKIAVSSDEKTVLTDALLSELQTRGHELTLFGAIAEGDQEIDWPLASAKVARAVAEGRADEGIVCCWTGTGAALAANKVRGVRAALCADAETAKGARIYNHANVLALSLRLTSPALLREILAAWFDTPWSEDDWNRTQIDRISELERS